MGQLEAVLVRLRNPQSQRRFASSIRAARRSLERMRDKRQKILDDPEGYRQQQIDRRVPDDFDELPEDEQEEILDKLEEVVASVDPTALKAEIIDLTRLVDQAIELEQREIESKLTKLREVLTNHGIFKDPEMKLLVFTEHKDTLDYLVGKLRDWNLTVTQIHGGMKIGDRDEPGTRIQAEREFRDEAQVLVATEAAGEGINLQFCWFMINYDIPWNPVRLEQRMGRIHRYGQEHDCLILNFVAIKANVEISADMFIITSEEAQKHIEPPVLSSLKTIPQSAYLNPGESLSFIVRGLDQHGNEIGVPIDGVQFTATGGIVDHTGNFVAGDTEGSYEVSVTFDGISATATVTVTQAGVSPPPPPQTTSRQKISWTGEVPAQKWMNYYMKVQSQYATEKDLKITLSFEVSPVGGASPLNVEDTKAALRELGLNDDITLG